LPETRTRGLKGDYWDDHLCSRYDQRLQSDAGKAASLTLLSVAAN